MKSNIYLSLNGIIMCVKQVRLCSRTLTLSLRVGRVTQVSGKVLVVSHLQRRHLSRLCHLIGWI